MKKYLKKLGWDRDKSFETDGGKFFTFDHPTHGLYQLFYSKDFYHLSDDSDELECDTESLTKNTIKSLMKDYVNKGVKSYS